MAEGVTILIMTNFYKSLRKSKSYGSLENLIEWGLYFLDLYREILCPQEIVEIPIIDVDELKTLTTFSGMISLTKNNKHQFLAFKRGMQCLFSISEGLEKTISIITNDGYHTSLWHLKWLGNWPTWQFL